ncbi:MAG: S-layer homology domain-containing protein [Nitriliruptorales bacterium]
MVRTFLAGHARALAIAGALALLDVGAAAAPVAAEGSDSAPVPVHTADSAVAAADADGNDWQQVVDLTFPTKPSVTFSDDYASPRSGGRTHRATDLLGTKMMELYAAVDGTVCWLTGVDEPMPSYGYMITICGDDGRDYSYVHVNNDTPGTDDGQGGPENAYASGISRGARVARGQLVGWMGDSGNAESTVAHLHFEIEDPTIVDPYGGNRINPYYSLRDALERGDISDGSVTIRKVPEPEALDYACPVDRVPEDEMGDVPVTATHEAAIDCVVWWGVGWATGDGLYSPGRDVTRGEMAEFVARLVERSGGSLPDAAHTAFTDVADSPYATSIRRLAAAGIVGGYADGTYLADRTVTRDQMATYLVKAYEYRTGESLPWERDHFTDDDGSVHEPRINSAAEAVIVRGRTTDAYDPAAPVARGAMASFLARVLDRFVEGGFGSVPSS